jgi:hypothetical protein
MTIENALEEILFKYKLSFAKSEKRFVSGFAGDFENAGILEGSVGLKKESMTLSAPDFPALTVSLRDIISFTAQDYMIFLTAVPSTFLKLYDLGFEYENFLKHFSDLRNDVFIKDLLMKEKLIKPDVEGEFEYIDKDGKIKEKGECRVRAYETGLVLIPQLSQIKRFPFGLIDSFESKDYKLGVKLENQDRLSLSMLGDQIDPLTRELSKSFNALISKTQDLIKEISPQENAGSLREMSFLLKDGKAARKSAVEKLSKKLWGCIEEKVKNEDVWEYYNFLKVNSDPEKTCVGIKKGLFGSSTGYYIWFLFPVYDGNSGNFANAVAMEAMTLIIPEESAGGGGFDGSNEYGRLAAAAGNEAESKGNGNAAGKNLVAGTKNSDANPDNDTDADAANADSQAGNADFGGFSSGGDSQTGFETGGRATYVFKIIDRARFAAEYKSGGGKQSGRLNNVIDSEYSDFTKKINSCMLAINFRREPIYFTDLQLKDSKNISYRYAVAMIPELAWLRDNFIGRIIHKDIREWKDDFKELITFNINSVDNFVKFKKGVR